MSFHQSPFWIRILDLARAAMTVKLGKKIGDTIGKCLEVDGDEKGFAKGISMWLQVMIDIRKPLRRGIKLTVGSRKEDQWFQIQYERLPNFCYGYGVLGHIVEDCDKEFAKDKPKQYGDWLRAKGNNGDFWIMEGRSYNTYTHSSNVSINQIQHIGNNKISETAKKLEVLKLKDGKDKID